MKEGWEIKKLGDVCDKITDGSHNPPKRVDSSDFMMLSSKNIYNDLIHYENPRYLTQIEYEKENKRTDVQSNDVLLTIVGTIGRVAVVPSNHPKFTLQRSVAVLKIKKEALYSRFLMFSLQNRLEYLTKEARGVAQKGIYLKQLKDITIPLPPLPEQKRIVALLDKAFTAIDIAKQNASDNLQNAKEVFESYTENLYQSLLKSRQNNLLDNLAKLVRGPFGGSLTKSMFVEKGYAVYEQRNAIGDFTNDFRYFITEEKYKEMGRFSVNSGDLLMSCSGTIGKFTVIKQNKVEGIINQALLKITPNYDKIDRMYLLFVLRNFINDGKGHSKGAAIKNIVAVKELKKIEIPLITIEEQKQIVEKLDSLSVETKNLEKIYRQKIEDLDELKKSILQKAFTGEL